MITFLTFLFPDNAPFALNDNGIYWIDDEENPFKGEFKDGQEYYVIMILKANKGYKFANEPSFGTNCDVLNYSHVADDRNLI